ncbi:MAG: four helix bundle protein, partial [Bacteroidales bacterium]
MATINRLEDLEVWKESKKLALAIYSHFRPLKDFGFRDQICRASVSVMNNIAEGFERNSDKEFQRFLSISKGSLGEVRSMIILAIDL